MEYIYRRFISTICYIFWKLYLPKDALYPKYALYPADVSYSCDFFYTEYSCRTSSQCFTGTCALLAMCIWQPILAVAMMSVCCCCGAYSEVDAVVDNGADDGKPDNGDVATTATATDAAQCYCATAGGVDHGWNRRRRH